MSIKEFNRTIIASILIGIVWGVILILIQYGFGVDIPSWVVGVSTGITVGLLTPVLQKKLFKK